MTDRKARPTLPDGFTLCTPCGELVSLSAMTKVQTATLCPTCHTKLMDPAQCGDLLQTAKETALRQWKNRVRSSGHPRVELTAQGKRCSTCHHVKPLDAYCADRERWNGFAPTCKSCAKIRRQLKAKGQIDLWPAVREALRLAPA